MLCLIKEEENQTIGIGVQDAEDLDLTLDDVHLMDSKEEMLLVLMVLVVTPFNS